VKVIAVFVAASTHISLVWPQVVVSKSLKKHTWVVLPFTEEALETRKGHVSTPPL
jgi:hypothetical protein